MVSDRAVRRINAQTRGESWTWMDERTASISVQAWLSMHDLD